MKENDYSKRFEQIIRSFPGGASAWQVFNDFLSLSAATFANSVPTPERESLLKSGIHLDNEILCTPFYYLNHWRFQPNENAQEEIPVHEKRMEITANMEYLEDTGGQMKFCLEELLKKTA